MGFPFSLSVSRRASEGAKGANRGAIISATARRSSVIYKSRERASIVFFVWLVYATPDHCDKFRVRGVVGRTTRWTDDKTGVPDFTVRARDASRVFDSVPRVFLDFPRKRRRGCRLVRARLVSARERLVLASLRGVRCDASTPFPTRCPGQLTIDRFSPPSEESS